MKKMIILLIIMPVIALSLAGCMDSFPGLDRFIPARNESESVETDSLSLAGTENESVETDSFSSVGHGNGSARFDDLEGLAKAAALSYHTMAQKESVDIDSPEFAWNTVGWYAVHRAFQNFSEDAVLSVEQIQALQKVILTGEITREPPDTIGAVGENRDGGFFWTFPHTFEESSSYLGISAAIQCDQIDNTAFQVTIRDYLESDKYKDTVFYVGFEQKKDGYSLSEFSCDASTDFDIPADDPSAGQDITLEMLREANLLTNLLSIYDTAVITEVYARGFGESTYVAKSGKGFAMWTDDGGKGYYHNYRFITQTDESERVIVWPAEGLSDYYIVNWLLPDEEDELISLTSSENEKVFRVENEGVNIVYTFDCESLALRKIERFNEYNESLSMVTLYGEKLDFPDTITAWQGSQRTVTLHTIYSENQISEMTFQIPGDWEFGVAEYCPSSTVYLDKNCTIPYKYPGDGIDYTLFVCKSEN